MSNDSVLIVGGGAAGLAAADALSSDGIPVTVIEARGRLGGRINTILSASGSVPIELGAEFLHGARSETWKLIRPAGLKTDELPDNHWESMNGVLVKNAKFWDELAKAMENINCQAPDRDFASYLAGQRHLQERARMLATEYVEGFHAAPSDTMSVHALKRAEEKAEKEEGTRQFRLTHGYSQLIEWMADRVRARNAAILLNQNVRIVRWKTGRVDVLAETPGGLQKHEGVAAILTIPLGVLQADPEEGVLFDPELAGKRRAITGMQMGAVIKITFEFTERFWPIENFGFIHSHQSMFPVWWSDGRGPLLTAWSGDGRAAWLSKESRSALYNEGVECLGRLFNLQSDFIQKRIAGIYHHDWLNDQFSRGAYSFTPVGMIHGPEKLREPVSDTLFFAGEATDSEGDQGTVQGALSSGERAAEEVLKTIREQYAAANKS